MNVFLQAGQIEQGIQAIAAHNLLHCLKVDAAYLIWVIVTALGNYVSHKDPQRYVVLG